MMKYLPKANIKILHNSIELGKIKHAIFDFDGTISILREGWEKVMEPVMIKSICGATEPGREIIEEVRKFIDDTTGIQTILQMEGLVEMVRKHGLVPEKKILDAWGYKRIYNKKLMVSVKQRIALLDSGEKTPADFTVAGAVNFCKKMDDRGVMMYLASGTDREDVRNEAQKVAAAQYFKGGIYGAIGTIGEYSKDKVIKEILHTHDLHGSELAVFGDGPVEIRNAKENGAIAVGVASDEVTGSGWKEKKIKRLTRAGCDILIPDFSHGEELLQFLFNEIQTGMVEQSV
ncbi:MAG TPA: HAD family hydrolase [Bacteroidetes bacterium]|nr:HAD family hydrolase [Bacteroidota bacterium]